MISPVLSQITVTWVKQFSNKHFITVPVNSIQGNLITAVIHDLRLQTIFEWNGLYTANPFSRYAVGQRLSPNFHPVRRIIQPLVVQITYIPAFLFRYIHRLVLHVVDGTNDLA